MIACFDVHYNETSAYAAVLVFENWDSAIPSYENKIALNDIAEYEPGNFYKRELPPLLELLSQLPQPPEILIIDGYCDLSESGQPGLGARLLEHLPYAPIIIGVAKNRFKAATHAIEVFRGGSARPLFITALGMSKEEAANKIASMHGSYRIPTMLKAVDSLARGNSSQSIEHRIS
ncbi:endonuclease V [Thiofilum flexile]|uniref:endonuclease V n=1 Tax=Thiofilum flexile TaxID=125627 RepID=UPI00036FB56C|nr:endonuclease V [Thiofilum flexile]